MLDISIVREKNLSTDFNKHVGKIIKAKCQQSGGKFRRKNMNFPYLPTPLLMEMPHKSAVAL